MPELGEAVQSWIPIWDDLRPRLIRLREEVEGALIQSGRATGDEARQIAESAVEIALNSDTGDQTDGTLSDSVLDFAVQQAVPRMGRTREAFDMNSSSADGVRPLPGGHRHEDKLTRQDGKELEDSGYASICWTPLRNSPKDLPSRRRFMRATLVANDNRRF